MRLNSCLKTTDLELCGIHIMKIVATSLLALFVSAEAYICEPGSVPNSQNICIKPKYIEGCYVYATQSKCQTCNYNYNIDSLGYCSFNPSVSEPCCLEMGLTGCAKCNRGLTLVNGGCSQISILGCLQKGDDGKCVNCDSEFVLQDGECHQGIKNCQSYMDASMKTCQKCLPSFSLVQNTCLRNRILGCKNQQNFSCITCFEPFKKAEGKCTISHCKSYNDFGCDSCDCGYYISSNAQCESIQEGCIRYQKGTCTDCIEPFSLRGAACVIDGCVETKGIGCLRCSGGYALEEGICKLPNCMQGMNGKCNICEKNFNYVNGECQPIQQKMLFN